jgi:hypothetical protein
MGGLGSGSGGPTFSFSEDQKTAFHIFLLNFLCRKKGKPSSFSYTLETPFPFFEDCCGVGVGVGDMGNGNKSEV